MTLTLTNNSAALSALIVRLKKLGGAQAMSALAGRLAPQARDLVVSTFDRSSSPDGVPWAPLRHRKGQPLVKTGKLKASIKTTHNSKGFVVSARVPYAAVHQFGGGTKARNQARTKGGRFKKNARAANAKRVVFVSRIGATTIPARPFFPGASLPPAWRERFTTTTLQFMKEFFG